MTTIPFTKMQGIGNDFVMLDALQDILQIPNWQEAAKRLNDRRFGIGGDGVILIEKGLLAPFRMRMWNPDGTESEMCGNGIRCFAKLLKDHGHLHSHQVDVETGAGILTLNLMSDGRVRVDMGEGRLNRGAVGMPGDPQASFIEQPLNATYQGTAVSMGNPHLVIFVSDISAIDLERVGPLLENHPEFLHRTNVHFAQAKSKTEIIQRTWERGAGITLACGTGACAVAVAAHETGRTGPHVEIALPGGSLSIEVGPTRRVYMTGPAETVFTGRISLDVPELGVR